MKKVAFLLVCILHALPATSQSDADIAHAELILRGFRIVDESDEAATQRANAALIAIMSGHSRPELLCEHKGVDYCTEREATRIAEYVDRRADRDPDRFGIFCVLKRRTKPNEADFKTDEQLKSEGCYTRGEAATMGCADNFSIRDHCQEPLPPLPPLPENATQVSESSVISCLRECRRVDHLYKELFDTFLDQEIQIRLEDLTPSEKESIQSHIRPTDV